MVAISFGCAKVAIPDIKGMVACGKKLQTIRPKTGRYKVGCNLQLYWRQRSKKVYKGTQQVGGCELLGVGVITDVFDIVMQVSPGGFMVCPVSRPIESLRGIAQKDGFVSLGAMVNWFNKRYNLSGEKTFTVVRWKLK